MRYRTIRHTADKGIIAWGRTLEELFENSAYGTFSLIADISRIAPEETKEIKINEQREIDLLLVDWLSELIYIFDVEKFLFTRFHVRSLEGGVDALCGGIRIREGIPWRGAYIKAVTYHKLRVEKTKDGYRARIFFDV